MSRYETKHQESDYRSMAKEEIFWRVSYMRPCKFRKRHIRGKHEEHWCCLIPYSTGHDTHLCTTHNQCQPWTHNKSAFEYFSKLGQYSPELRLSDLLAEKREPDRTVVAPIITWIKRLVRMG